MFIGASPSSSLNTVGKSETMEDVKSWLVAVEMREGKLSDITCRGCRSYQAMRHVKSIPRATRANVLWVSPSYFKTISASPIMSLGPVMLFIPMRGLLSFKLALWATLSWTTVWVAPVSGQHLTTIPWDSSSAGASHKSKGEWAWNDGLQRPLLSGRLHKWRWNALRQRVANIPMLMWNWWKKKYFPGPQ